MKPILFNTEMVRAILDGRKTVTRRVIDRDIVNNCDMEKDGTLLNYQNCHGDFINPVDLCRYRVNDMLYVRETFWKGVNDYVYRADIIGDENYNDSYVWSPSIHMPKEAARIFLKVTGVRVERLWDMIRSEMVQEGIVDHCVGCKAVFGCDLCMAEGAVEDEFADLWDSTIKKDQLQYYGWNANPYVWVIEFEVIDKAKLQGTVGVMMVNKLVKEGKA